MNANLHDILTIQILGWNSAAHLPALLATLTPHAGEVQVRYIDNASEDNSVALVQAALPDADIVRVSENTGYCGGHNIGFARCTTPFVLTVNPDTKLDWPGIKKLVEVLQHNATAGAGQGLLLRSQTPPVIDSAGIMRTITLNGVDRGTGMALEDFTVAPTEIDAATGACALYRMEALKAVAYGSYEIAGHEALEVFDKDFFAYKEDVDLGWRLQRALWVTIFIPVTVAIHPRQLHADTKTSLAWITDTRTALSLRNYMWMIAKNATGKQLLLHELFIDARLIFFFLISLLYWPLLPVWVETLRGLPDMLHKRSYEAIHNNR